MPLAAVDYQTSLSAGSELPADPIRSAHRANAPAVDAQQMAPGTHGRDVVVFIAATGRAELDVVRRDVSARAYWARAAMAIANVDVAVGNVRIEQVTPGFPER